MLLVSYKILGWIPTGPGVLQTWAYTKTEINISPKLNQKLLADEHRFVKVCIAKLRKSSKVHCSGQCIALISYTTSGLPESVSKIFVENKLYSQVVRANCIWQSERRELFARTIRASIRIRVSVNTQAKSTTRTFARIVRVSVKRPLEVHVTAP